jgi:hypothetical protein
MSKEIEPIEREVDWSRFSELSAGERGEILSACADLTDSIYGGLNVEREIKAVDQQGLGDTILIWDNSKLAGFAVCHSGRGTEAGSGVCYIKFGAVRPGATAERDFSRLLDAGEEMAAAENQLRLLAGANMARHAAYRHMLARGFRTELQGVEMSKPNEAGYNRADVYLIDDWR